MNKYVEQFAKWWTRYKDAKQKFERERKYKRVTEQSEHSIQVREYEGKLWLTVDNVPLLREADINGNLMEAVQNARTSFVVYNMNHNSNDVLIPDLHVTI